MFQNSDDFKEKAKERYKIEAKNSELKHRHGYDVASSSGLISMKMQSAMSLLSVNLKRIITLMKERVKIKILESSIFLILKNVLSVLSVKDVIKKERKVSPIQ